LVCCEAAPREDYLAKVREEATTGAVRTARRAAIELIQVGTLGPVSSPGTSCVGRQYANAAYERRLKNCQRLSTAERLPVLSRWASRRRLGTRQDPFNFCHGFFVFPSDAGAEFLQKLLQQSDGRANLNRQRIVVVELDLALRQRRGSRRFGKTPINLGSEFFVAVYFSPGGGRALFLRSNHLSNTAVACGASTPGVGAMVLSAVIVSSLAVGTKPWTLALAISAVSGEHCRNQRLGFRISVPLTGPLPS
jgi:hypothetical protein